MRGSGSWFFFGGVVLWHLLGGIFRSHDVVSERVSGMTRDLSESATQHACREVRGRRQRRQRGGLRLTLSGSEGSPSQMRR